MTIIRLLLLMASAMTNFPESKSLAQDMKLFTSTQKKTTCGIRRLDAFDMMLTCYFHHNISALQRDFTVYHYKEQQQSPKTVLACDWIPTLTCQVAPGYKYEDDIVVNDDHTNVRIINASAQHVGMYTCQVMGEINFGTCNLTEEQLQSNSSLTPHTQLISTTEPAQTTTTTTSLLPDDRQTQSADEQSSAAYAPGGSQAEEQKQTGSQENNTVVVVVPSVVVAVSLSIIIIAVMIALYRRRQRIISRMVHKGSSETLLSQSQEDEHHRDISPPKVEDCETTDSQLTVQEDRQHKPAGIQERGDVDVEDETSFDGRQPELQQRNSHIDPPKNVVKEEEEDSPVTQSALTTGHVNVGAV